MPDERALVNQSRGPNGQTSESLMQMRVWVGYASCCANKARSEERRAYGRKLSKSEMVHHDDRNKLNFEESNLIITTRTWHINEHRKEMNAGRGIGV